MPAPMTDTERQQIVALHAEGLSCTAIAKRLGRATSTISRVAPSLGITWDRAGQTAAAAEAVALSNRERRAKAVRRLYDRAERVLDRLDADQFKVVGFDRDGYARVTPVDADAIPGTEERALSGMAVNLLVAAARLEQVDAAHSDTSEAKGILGNLQDALGAAYASLSHTSSPSVHLPETDAGDTDAQH